MGIERLTALRRQIRRGLALACATVIAGGIYAQAGEIVSNDFSKGNFESLGWEEWRL